MDIGSNIRKARLCSGLTQEQAAERLGVSRQTISNWENNKTIPDGALVKTISQVYGVGVGDILNEPTPTEQVREAPAPDYPQQRIAQSLVIYYLCGWLGCILYFWLLGGGGALFFGAIILGIVFPAITFFVSTLLGLFDCYPLFRFYMIFAFGLVHTLLPYLTYSLRHMVSVHRLSAPDMNSFFIGLCVSAVGILFGCLVRSGSTWITNTLQRRTPSH
jgi:transcriptional regulator with XRE-family HTH domain